MSLLQEALKRKEQDESQRKPETESAAITPPVLPADAHVSNAGQQAAEPMQTGVPPDSPSQSMPVAGQNQSVHRKTSFLWMIVAAIAVFIGLTITAGTAFFFYRIASPVKVKTYQQPGYIDNTPAVITGKTEISAGKLTSVPGPESAGRTETEAHQAVAPDANKEATLTGAATQTIAVALNKETNSVREQSAGNAGNKPPAATPFIFKPKASTPVSQSARWPALKLTGILRGAGAAESTAFINGKMISAGQAIADVTIVEIQTDGVILKYGNEKRFLRVGATSY